MDFVDNPVANVVFPSYANTPAREESPGRLGDVPDEGPPTLYNVEELVHSPFALAGLAWDEWKEAFLYDLQEGERIIDLVERFQEREREVVAMHEWAATL